MPTKTFSAIDATLFSQTISGNILVQPAVSHAISSLITGISIGVFDFTTGTYVSNYSTPYARVLADTPIIRQVFDINYLDIVLGLPTGAKIKKMVINAPCSANFDLSTGPPDNVPPYEVNYSGGPLWCAADLLFKVNAITHTLNIVGAIQNPPAPDPAAAGGTIISDSDSLNGSAADVVIFDLTAGPTFITRDDFVTDYSRIQLDAGIVINGRNTEATSFFGQPTIITLTIFSMAAESGWSITVTYEAESFSWELSNPPTNRAVQPGNVLEFTSNPSDPTPLDFTEIETLDIELLDADGNVVGTTVNIPQILWTTITPNLFRFILPDFFQSGINIQRMRILMTSTQFTGSVTLQEMWVIYFYNAPGVYTLIEGRKHDTYYDREDVTISTVDTKIPNPSGRTGYY